MKFTDFISIPRKVYTREPGAIALGAGVGIIFGAALGDVGVGMVLGAALGLALSKIGPDDQDGGTS